MMYGTAPAYKHTGDYIMDEKKDTPKGKLTSFLVTVFYLLCDIGLLTILIVGTIMHLGPVLSVVLLFVLLLLILLLYRSVKKEDRQKAEYRETYISEVTMEDPVLGTLVFEKNSEKNTFCCQEGQIPFGNYHPMLCIDGYEENQKDFFFQNLKILYSRQDEIVQNMLSQATEDFSMSMEKLQESFTVTCIRMQRYDIYLLGEDPLDIEPGDWIITVEGKPDADREGYYITPTACMDCKTQKIDYMAVE